MFLLLSALLGLLSPLQCMDAVSAQILAVNSASKQTFQKSDFVLRKAGKHSRTCIFIQWYFIAKQVQRKEVPPAQESMLSV